MRYLIALLAILLLAAQLKIWVGEDGLMEYRQLTSALEASRQEGDRLLRINHKIQSELEDLQSGTQTIAQKARQSLGMMQEDETFIRIVDLR